LLKQFRSKSFLIIALFLSGCATTYQKEGFFSNGYSDSRVAEDIFHITFRANEYTPPEEVYRLVLQRASELALKHHYKYFIILEQIDSSNNKKSKQKAIYYPSLYLKIQCFHESQGNAIDAEQYFREQA
jgi:hypothetical protein